MSKFVWTYGLISGAILALTFAVTLPFHDFIGFDNAMFIGYTSMILAFLLVFFGVRAYRDQVGQGQVGFGRAFSVGLLIAVVGSLCYVIAWEVVLIRFAPEYMTKYSEHVIEKEREKGASPEAIAAKQAEMAKFAEMYKNPLINSAMTFCEPMPVGLIVALVSAGVLSRRRRPEAAPSTT